MGDHDFLGPDRPRHDGLNLLKAGEAPEVLATDSRLFTSPLSDYPFGMSVMRTEDFNLVDSFGYHMDIGTVLTFRSNDDSDPGDEIGSQLVFSNQWTFHRFWNDTTNEWEFGESWATNADISAATGALPIAGATVDTIAENAAIGSWSSNKMTIMHASAAANYGPNSGEAGMVITEAIVTAGSDVSARQVFIRSSDGRPYVRYHDGTSWTSWRDDDPQNAIEAHSRVPTQDENDALQGTNGSPSGSNRYVTDSDARNTNARTPTSHASSHAWGGADPVRPSKRAIQTLSNGSEIAVGNDTVIVVHGGSADKTGLVMAVGSFDGQFVQVVNRSGWTLNFDASVSTCRVVGSGAIPAGGQSTFTWDADYAGAGVGRWVRLSADSAAAVASLRTLGTGSTQALPGNHSSTTDARTPTAHTHSGDILIPNGIDLPEQGSPSSPSADIGRLYTLDVGGRLSQNTATLPAW